MTGFMNSSTKELSSSSKLAWHSSSFVGTVERRRRWIPGNAGVRGPNHERNPGDSELAASRRDTPIYRRRAESETLVPVR